MTARRKRLTTYAVTTERAVIIDHQSSVRYVELDAVLHETTTQQHGRAVTVLFRSPSDPALGRLEWEQDPVLKNALGNT